VSKLPMTAAELGALLLRNLPSVDHRGETIEEIAADHVKLRLPVIESYLSRDLPTGSGQAILSGPITIGFAETAMYACIHAAYGVGVLAVTLSLHISFLRVAGAGDLIAVARLLRRGKSVAFVEAHLYSGQAREACAQVTASYAIRSIDSA
jgi:uncharacterized protein (TIGR00369 family)